MDVVGRCIGAYTSVAALVAALVRRQPLAPLLVAGAWTGVELARDRWPFGGYPWGAVATTQGSVPSVRWLAGVIGVYGLSFLIVFFSALVADRILRGRWSRQSIAVVVVVLAAFVAVDVFRYGRPPGGRPVRLLVVQGGVPRPPRPDQRDYIFQSHIRLTNRIYARAGGRVDLVIWPEDSIGIGVSPGARERVAAEARDLGRPILLGRSVVDGSGKGFFNTIQHVTRQGDFAGRYVKRHPVPFGEYVPVGFLRNVVSTLESEVPFDQRRGTRSTVFSIEGTRIAVPICFESVFPRDILDFARKDADLYVVATNNASFERSYASQQHLVHARMRALETRQWVVQAALAGISGVAHPSGEVSNETGLFETTAFVATVRARPAQSLYARIGDVFPAFFAVLTLAALVRFAHRRLRASLLRGIVESHA